jgi:hypothetical protein
VRLGPKRRGRWSHGQPERIRKMMPLRARRQSAWCRPVRWVGQNSWRMGRIRSQRGSGPSPIVPSGWRLRAFFLLGFGVVAVLVRPSRARPPFF